MAQVTKRHVVKGWETLLSNKAIRHILLNYSASEVGLRHPVHGAGVIFRDQGVADLYSGEARMLLFNEGKAVLLSHLIALAGEDVNILVPGIENLRILGKTINKTIFEEEIPVATVQVQNLDGLALVGPNTTDSQGGPLFNTIPLDSVLGMEVLFEPGDEDSQGLISSDIESFVLLDRMMSSKV